MRARQRASKSASAGWGGRGEDGVAPPRRRAAAGPAGVPGTRRSGQGQPRRLGLRRPQIRRGFRPFRLRQPGRAQGRDAQAVGARHLRDPQPLHPQGPQGGVERAPVRHADGARLRRAGCALRPGRRGGRAPRGGRLGRVPAQARGPVPRRHAGHGRRRRLHLPDPGGEGPSAVPHPVPRRGRGGGRRPAQGPVRLQARAAPRPAGPARGAAGVVEGVLRQGRVRQDDLHPAALQRALPRRQGGARTVGDL